MRIETQLQNIENKTGFSPEIQFLRTLSRIQINQIQYSLMDRNAINNVEFCGSSCFSCRDTNDLKTESKANSSHFHYKTTVFQWHTGSTIERYD